MKQDKYQGKFQKKGAVKSPASQKKVEFTDFASGITNQKVLNSIAILLPAAIIINYFFFLNKYYINFPFFDDFEAILGSLRQYITCHSVHEKVRLLWAQHGEHRVVFLRVVSLFEYYLLGEVNFRSLILIGNCALLVLLIMLYKSVLLKHKVHLLYLMPAVPVLFNLKYWETSFWATAALANLWVACFVLISLYFLFNKNPYSIYLSILFGWIATYTGGSGMMAFIAGAFVLIINKEFFNAKKIGWFLAGALVIGTYFYHYVKPSTNPPILEPLMKDPLGFLGYIFAFLGGGLSDDLTVAIIAGIILFLSVVYISFKEYYKSNPVIYAFIIFILITSALASLTRFGLGLAQALSSRYALSSLMLTVCCYFAILSFYYQRMKVLYFIALTAIAFYFHYNINNKLEPYKIGKKQEFDQNYALVMQGRLSNFNYGWQPLDERKDLPKRELKAADSIGYFKFKFTDDSLLINSIPTDTTKEAKFRIEKCEQDQPNRILITGWALIRHSDADYVMNVICFKNEKGVPVKYVVCKQYSRPDVTNATNGEANYDNCGFVTFFHPKELPPGRYNLTMFLTDSKFKVEINTGQQLVIK